MRIVADIIEYTSAHCPKFNSISISGYHMQEAGATAVQELAFTLADGKDYVRSAMARGLDIDQFAGRLSFFFAIGMNFFMEVAKLRAARLLWAEIMGELGAKDPRSRMLRTHCQTSGVSLTQNDPWNNIVRTAYEALAAVLGGTQSLHTNSFDEAIALPTDMSARIARNTQLILQHETGVTNVIDPLGGSYYVEALTRDLADAARGLIGQVDALGGMTHAIREGMPQRHIEEAAAATQARIDNGETVVVGVNTYRLENEPEIAFLDVDNAAVRAGQIARIEAVRAGRDEGACRAALDALREGAKGQANLLALSIDAARARATLGEISLAMEDVFGRHSVPAQTVRGIYAKTFGEEGRLEQVREGIAAIERRKGRPPRVLIAKMGQDGHDRGAKVVGSAYADFGFDVRMGPLFQKPEEAAALAISEDVDVVGASSLAAGHRTLVPELIRALKELGRPDIRVVAGGVIPAQDYQALFDAGVAAIYGPGTNVVESAADLLRLLGHNMPPLEATGQQAGD